ncbi:MAG: tetratricopeptide repeat protein [Candidatus Omnitrophica bacterium]|nr:tetratricopeptide repeat protein [Candidatus Omnitrophota bacterium]MDD5574166.1 tetratricopeptide repeat protein [Candidatus Omnitrophota bacterium]
MFISRSDIQDNRQAVSGRRAEVGRLGLLFILVVIVFLVFLPSLRNGFINWDDQVYVLNNSSIKALTAANIRTIFTSFYVSNYQPLTILSFLADYQVWQLRPFGYHLSNLLLHLGNVLLVFGLVRLLSGRYALAFLVALLFGVHPLRAESVAWIAERKDVLYAFFYLGALVSYVFYLTRGLKSRFLWITLALFFLSLLSKSMAVTLPVMLFCFDYFFRRRPDGHMFLEKIPFFALSAAFALIALYSVYGGHHDIAGRSAVEGFFGGPLFALAFYLEKIFWPVSLSAYYPMDMFYGMAHQVKTYVWIFLFFSVCVLSARRTRKAVFGCLFFIVCLLPLLQILPMGDTKVADRWAYLAGIGIFYILGEVFFRAWDACRGPGARLRYALVGLAVVVVVLSAVTTFQRCGVWKDSVTFWTDVLKKYPRVVIAYNNRGLAFINEGAFDRALRDSSKMARIIDERYALYKGYYQLYNLNLAMLYELSQERYQEVIELAQEAIRLDPDKRYRYQINLAVAYASLGDAARAEKLLRDSIQNDPETRAEGYYNLALVFLNRKEAAEAEKLFHLSLQANPDFGLAHQGLAVLSYGRKDIDGAIARYKQALASGARDTAVYNDLVAAMMDKDDYAGALPYAREAVAAHPGDAATLSNLGSVLCGLGRAQEALGILKEALSLEPSFPDIHNNICFAYYLNGDCRRAASHCRRAQELGYPVSDVLWQRLDSCRP